MKTTSTNYSSSIVPGMIAQKAHVSLKGLKLDKEIIAEVSSIINQDVSFNNFLEYFQLNTIERECFLKAFTHSSFINDYGLSSLESYQRLEFLGDSVLELLVTEMLLKKFPSLPEGALSKLRSQLVSKGELATLGCLLGLEHFILVGNGEYHQKVFQKCSIMADTFESVLGVIYSEAGLEHARQFLLKLFNLYEKKYSEPFIMLSRIEGKNYKGRLQEFLMKSEKNLPVYTDVKLDTGEFFVTVVCNDKVLGKSINNNKKQAQINAAKMALEQLTH